MREARAEVERARAQHRRITARRGQVDAIAEELRLAIDRNHFGESIELALRRKASS
ncbi:hypothetical protein IU448_15295 [Nocardia flavorosea]|uniref:DUF7620 family protein n=1 Tax=Nocardia flavorosea TaxID=53429 RepID=UPI001895CF45|nr:hypothetical protein [Nocardia flavorosea]MBF6350371.1 hypothetical protein [Nocardia flavorosea]